MLLLISKQYTVFHSNYERSLFFSRPIFVRSVSFLSYLKMKLADSNFHKRRVNQQQFSDPVNPIVNGL